jgi:hypothetical protein
LSSHILWGKVALSKTLTLYYYYYFIRKDSSTGFNHPIAFGSSPLPQMRTLQTCKAAQWSSWGQWSWAHLLPLYCITISRGVSIPNHILFVDDILIFLENVIKKLFMQTINFIKTMVLTLVIKLVMINERCAMDLSLPMLDPYYGSSCSNFCSKCPTQDLIEITVKKKI